LILDIVEKTLAINPRRASVMQTSVLATMVHVDLGRPSPSLSFPFLHPQTGPAAPGPASEARLKARLWRSAADAAGSWRLRSPAHPAAAAAAGAAARGSRRRRGSRG